MQTKEMTRTLPDIDQAVANQTGNDILLDVAKGEKSKKVRGGGSRATGAIQSHSARAWTRSGDVD